MKSNWKLRKKNIYNNDDKHSVANYFGVRPNSLMFQFKMAQKIKGIKVRLDEIMKQTIQINALLPQVTTGQPIPIRNNATAELYLLGNAEESEIPRRDREKDRIISKLVESYKGDNVLVVSIVGIGGSGKTTLAKQICHDEKIKKHFNDKIYRVHVSREFDVDRLVSNLFEDITKEKSDLHSRSHMVNEISKKLKNNKFLLVLDDAWHTNRHDWEQFMLHVKISTSGSRVLLTTRDVDVAYTVNSWYMLKLEFLSELESWSFFLKISEWSEDEGTEHLQLGKDIVKKCGGVPLAIKILGGVLHGKSDINTWRTINRSSLWNDKNIEDQVFACLKLSYIHLEYDLQQCFMLCSIFPKGYKINRNRLISQWIAHGFVNPRNEECVEDIGSEYFESLVKIGFLQNAIENSNNVGRVYKMHDLIHDLTRKVSHDELMTSLPNNMTIDYPQNYRYLSLTSCTDNQKVDRRLLEKARAIFVSYGSLSFDQVKRKSWSVRSVILHYTTYNPFLLSISKFEYLGYLEVHNIHCEEVLETISRFWNLRSLHFSKCRGFMKLPESIGKLKKLRTLELHYIYDLTSLPQSIGDCHDLQSLILYHCRELREVPRSMGKLKNLREIHIVACSSLKQLPADFIGEFNNLHTINLAGCKRFQGLQITLCCDTLLTLNLSSTKITALPQWVTSIGTLECIDLEKCTELVELPKGLGNLKRLDNLNLQGCKKLCYMASGLGHLTRLRKLGMLVVGCSEDDARISELKNLDMLSGDMIITNLRYVKDPSEAEEACLKRKNNIQTLKLVWSSSETEEGLVSDKEVDLGVLDALEPPVKIEELCIKYCGSPCLPWWMRKQVDYSDEESKMLKQVDSCRFPCLTTMKLHGFRNLEHMQGLVEFPLLNELELDGMPNLEELWTTSSGSEIGEDKLQAQHCFPVLSSLIIVRCPKLIVKPHFPSLLESLHLEESNEQLLSADSFSHTVPSPVSESSFRICSSRQLAVPLLKALLLRGMTGLSSGWEFLQHLTALERFSISGSIDMTQLPKSIRSLTSLQDLGIFKCPVLGVLPEWIGELGSLRALNVCWTPMMGSLPQSIERLTSLVKLYIGGWDNLKQLPESLQHLTSLQHLLLNGCPALSMLPECLGHLSALRSLYISNCRALQYLPRSIQSLTALERLLIHGCGSGLATRYKQGVGDDWHLLSHIPLVHITDEL